MFKPFNMFLMGGLSVALLAEAVTLRLNLLGKKQEAEEGTLAKYNEKFVKVMESLQKTSVSSGFKYKNSSTPREMVLNISSKFPDQKKLLDPVLLSVEAHIYGEVQLTNEDLNNYARWLSIASTLRAPGSRMRV
jgi:hypothetical protein